MRNHTIRITHARWQDTSLREKVIADARSYAGRNPGVIVTIKKENQYKKNYYEVWKRFANWSGEKQEW
jgi:hypothetical protein